MRKTILHTLLLFALFTAAVPLTSANASVSVVAQPDFYTAYTDMLQRYVRQGQVNYRGLSQNKAQLQNLVDQVASYDLKGVSASEKKAFYLNAYNLLVLQQVLEHYPLKSVMDVKGFFDQKKYKVAGQLMTLNALEKEKLLQPYQDARIHFALVCAAKSCPPLLSEAYTPKQVEQQLEAQTKRTLQSSNFIKVQPGNEQVQVSEIFKWYKDDFLSEAPSVLAYINRYRARPIPNQYTVGYYPYSWQLNEIK